MTEAAPEQNSKANAARGWLLPVIIAMALKFKSLAWFGGSLLTMLLSVWIFAQRDGLPYAVCLVLLILIHELGHWIWMRACGLKPKAPMFIPGLGAFVAMTKLPASEATHAWVALAGPLIGGIGSALFFAVGRQTDNHFLLTAGNSGFMLNLLQLLPAKPLDGGFVVHAVSKWLLIPGTVLLALAAMMTGSSMLWLIAIFSLLSIFRRQRSSIVRGTPEGNIPVEESETEVITAPATAWERVGIGVAYITLIGALAAGYLFTHWTLKQ